MTSKKCCGCDLLLSLNEFHKDIHSPDGLTYRCKKCRNAQSNKWKGNNKEKVKETTNQWREDNNNHLKMYQNEWRKNNKVWFNNYMKERKKNDPVFKISVNIRSRLRLAILNNQKLGSAVKDLGCSVIELKQHLELKFYLHPETKEMMTWNNYGLHGWHIDHIIPLASFDLSNKEQFLKACHYTNLQPLWAEENIKKGAKV